PGALAAPSPKSRNQTLSRDGTSHATSRKAVLAGAATGLRSTSAVAALIPARAADPPAALTEPVAAGRQGSVSPASRKRQPSTLAREEDTQMKRSGLAAQRRRY